jgi:hypothetical protein
VGPRLRLWIPPDPATTTDFETYGLAYVAQIVELTPGQRSRYQSQIRALAALTALTVQASSGWRAKLPAQLPGVLVSKWA